MALHDVKTVRFGPFELDLESEELRRGGEPLAVQPQPLRVLALLIGQQGRLMSREQLQHKVWGEPSLHDGRDHSLNHTIRKLRQVLGDSATRPVYIQTVPRRGYRFIAKTEVSPSASVSGPGEGSSLEIGELEGLGEGPLQIRVMPFHDIVEHASLPPLADGAVHELITALVRLQRRGVIVIDGPVDGKHNAGDHDFRLQGAVRITGGQVRVNAYLVRSRDDRVFGTADFEERFGELFELQRVIAERIVAKLIEPLLEEMEKRAAQSAAHDGR